MKFKDALLSVLIIEVGVALLAVINYGSTLESLQAVTRFSGRVSLGIFSLIFLFQNHRHLNVTRFLSANYFFVFAFAHGIHLIQLLCYVYLSGNELIPVRLAGGFLACLLIFIMPYAQHLHEQHRIPQKKYSTLTLIYLYYVWFIFFMSYLPHVRGELPGVGGSYSGFVVLLAWVSLMMGVKLQGLLMSKISLKK